MIKKIHIFELIIYQKLKNEKFPRKHKNFN